MLLFCYVLGTISFLMLSIFARKHFKFIDRNSTSIQDLSLGNRLEVHNPYDLGRELNWKQVMG